MSPGVINIVKRSEHPQRARRVARLGGTRRVMTDVSESGMNRSTDQQREHTPHTGVAPPQRNPLLETPETRLGPHSESIERTPGYAHAEGQRHSAARSTCAAAFSTRFMAHGAVMVVESMNMFDDVLFTSELIVLMPPTIC